MQHFEIGSAGIGIGCWPGQTQRVVRDKFRADPTQIIFRRCYTDGSV